MKDYPNQYSTPQPVKRRMLAREILADLETPLSTYLKVANCPGTYLFESVTGGDKWGRYSIIGMPCRDVVKFRGTELSIERDGKLQHQQTVEDPLDWVEKFHASFQCEGLGGSYSQLRFTGGLVGYFGYETINFIEPGIFKDNLPDPLGTPDILLMVSEEVIVFDNLNGTALIIVHVDSDQESVKSAADTRQGSTQEGEAREGEAREGEAREGEAREANNKLAATRLDEIEALLRGPAPHHHPSGRQQLDESSFVSGYGQNSFMAGVEKVRDYITAGDCMQVVLSQRMTAPFSGHSLDLYRALRMLNPSPYMYYLDLGEYQIVGSSPEILVRLEEDAVTVRPIAGTRPRGATEVEDKAHEESLLADPKELAEHLMLIDLGRNDAGRVSEAGTVELTEKMTIERYSHVMHIVSNVTGKLKQGLSAMDVLRATFPAGTVSGAPKIRAMEIINELEPVKRGVYSGAVGYLSFNGNMDTAIAIRTAVVKDGELTIQAGAGVVYDSVPLSEWDETLNKARAVVKAASLAAGGLDDLPQQTLLNESNNASGGSN